MFLEISENSQENTSVRVSFLIKKLSVFGGSGSRRLPNFLQTHIFESLITFPEPTIKLITGIFDLQK